MNNFLDFQWFYFQWLANVTALHITCIICAVWIAVVEMLNPDVIQVIKRPLLQTNIIHVFYGPNFFTASQRISDELMWPGYGNYWVTSTLLLVIRWNFMAFSTTSRENLVWNAYKHARKTSLLFFSNCMFPWWLIWIAPSECHKYPDDEPMCFIYHCVVYGKNSYYIVTFYLGSEI